MTTVNTLQSAIDLLADLAMRYEVDREANIELLHQPSSSIHVRASCERAAEQFAQRIKDIERLQDDLAELQFAEQLREERYLPGSYELAVPYGAPLVTLPVDPIWSDSYQ